MSLTDADLIVATQIVYYDFNYDLIHANGQEAIRVQQKQIASMRGKMVHYQWSLVGNLLFSLPGSRYQSIRTESSVYKNYQMAALLQKHDTGFVLLTAAGAVIPGVMDRFAREVGNMTRSIENCPVWIGNFIIHVITRMIQRPKKDFGKTIIPDICRWITDILNSSGTNFRKVERVMK